MIHVLIFQHALSSYLFSNIDDVDVIYIPVVKPNIFHRIIRYVYYKYCSKLYSFYFPAEVNYKIKNIPANETLIFLEEDTYMYWVVSHLCKHVKHKVAYFWNPCSSIVGQKVCKKIHDKENKENAIVEYIRALGFKMATFDKDDSAKYDMAYFPQFYRKPHIGSSKQSFKQDFFFCGRDKGRKELVNCMKDLLTQVGVCNFLISGTNSKDSLNYFEYIEELRNSRVLCEVVQPMQIGLTVRAMEALFYKKKLITNNFDIVNYDFYNANNILVINKETTVQNVENFLLLPYCEINSEIIDRYEIKNMLNYLSNI